MRPAGLSLAMTAICHTPKKGCKSTGGKAACKMHKSRAQILMKLTPGHQV